VGKWGKIQSGNFLVLSHTLLPRQTFGETCNKEIKFIPAFICSTPAGLR
jgi:hypothetical protein